MANILQPFVTPGGDVLAYPRANTIVVTDIDSNVGACASSSRRSTSTASEPPRRVFKVKEGDPTSS
jgi:type II secretory pathway component GspD/PulD (secretin)